MYALFNKNVFATFILVLFSIALFTCNKDNGAQDNNPNTNPTGSGAAFCDISYEGKDYTVDGLGSTVFSDTSFVFSGGTTGIDTFDYNSITFSIVEGTGTANYKTFVGLILNYTGPGKYTILDYDMPENGGLYWLWYSDLTSAETGVEGFGSLFAYSEEANGEITITKDNSDVFEGNFSIFAIGEVAGEETEGIMRGDFAIQKQ